MKHSPELILEWFLLKQSNNPRNVYFSLGAINSGQLGRRFCPLNEEKI